MRTACGMRPNVHYRREFRRLILAESPRAVLEVGCGDGELLGVLQDAGVPSVGLEVRLDKVEALRAAGLDARLIGDESLPFPDRSFDLVVSEYCAHHFSSLARHMAEAVRVATRGVFLLDPWFDASIPSQRVARRWDDWLKSIDRATGKVHNEVLDAQVFLTSLPPAASLSVEVRHLLRLVPIDEALFESDNALALADAPDRNAATAQLDPIRAAKAQDGLSEDGAILVLLRRPSPARSG